MKIDFDEINKKFKLLLERINSKSNQKRIGELVVDLVYKRVKTGYGVNSLTLPLELTKKDRLKKLSPSYIEYRKGKVRFFKKNGITYPVKGNFPSPVTGRFGSSTRSNLTLTGQMLDALGFRILNDSIVIEVSNSTRSNSILTNSRVADLVSEERPFLAITDREFVIVEAEITKIIDQEIVRIFK